MSLKIRKEWENPFKMFKKILSQKKRKKEKKDDIKDISTNEILVRVYKDFGSNTQILKAEYFATERRDLYNNLISINTSFAHNEDTDFSMSDIYREMQIILEFKNKPKEEKLKLLQAKIEYQDKLLRYLERYPKLNAMYNYCDEDLKSRDLKILKNYIQNHDGEGAYFSIENGLRVYSFMACDGYLAPIWHGIDRYSQYPDHTRKLKITVQEDARMREEIREYSKEKRVGDILKWGLVIVVIFFLVNCVLGYFLYEKHRTLDDRIYESAFRSADFVRQLNEAYGNIIQETLITPNNKQIEQKITTLDPDTVS